MLHKVNFGVSSFSVFGPPEFLQKNFVPNNVIPLAVAEVRPPRKHMPLFPSLKVKPNASIALHLPIAHDETPRQVAICNDDYKFVVFQHSIILQKFTVLNEVMAMFHPEIVRILHSQSAGSYRVLK